MKIVFCSVGKQHDAYIQEGVDDFTGRIKKYFPVQWQIVAPPKNAASLPANELKQQEAKSVLQQISKEDFLVLLDERGKTISSPELATFIQQKANMSVKNLVFLVGGAFGVHEEIIKRADFTWSLSKLVFPHMLVRLILAEQVYRACTILNNEKYHHL